MVDREIASKDLPKPVDCLIPGPAGKQIVRLGPATWLALTGRRRGTEVTDLVLSVAKGRTNPACVGRWT